MRKTLTAFVLVLSLFIMTGAALAASDGAYLPPGANEATVWEKVDGSWTSLGLGNSTAPARSWNSMPKIQGFTNKEQTGFEFTSHASVAQWIEWSVGGTRKDWRIRRPGTYASDSIQFTISSNNDVDVEFSGFDDMIYENPDLVPVGTKDHIPTWYGISLGGDEVEDVLEWIRASDLNEMSFSIPNSNALHFGESTKIFSKIEVCECNNSSDYENVGSVTFVLTNMKHWIDAQSGKFKWKQK